MAHTDMESLSAIDGSLPLADRLADTTGLLLGLDYDGTLAPIADDPDAPEIPPSIRDSLEQLAAHDRTRVAVVSGRALDDLHARVTLDGAVYAGNHGLELLKDGERTVPSAAQHCLSALDTARQEIHTQVESIPGCHIEDKGVTFTVHVRQTPDEHVETVRTAVEDAVAGVSDIKSSEGKKVFEVRPAIEGDKGTTMATLQREAPAGWQTLYLGDDTTDEDAFEAIQPDGIGIHVGDRPETAASYRIDRQQSVAPFLSWLVSDVLESE